MLTQHLKYVTLKFRSVKFLPAAAIAAASVMVMPMTVQASPSLESIVTTKYSAKFDREMFKSEAGIQQIYLTLQKKAKKACKIGSAVNDDGDRISKKECAIDLLDQFVETAGVTTLTAYHERQEKMSG